MRTKLTERQIAALKPAMKRYDVSDSVRVGLRIRVAPSGLKSWVFEKRIRGGPLRSHTLGRFPAISLSDARNAALDLEREAMKGIDRKHAQNLRHMVEDVLESYRKLHLNNLRTGNERHAQLNTYLAPYMSAPISNLERSHLQAIIDEKAGEGKPVMANRLKAALSAFSKFAWRRGYTDTDPGAGLSIAARERPRERVLSLEEIRAIYRACDALRPLWAACIKLLILTAQRRGDIAGLLVAEVEFENRRIVLPAQRTKSGRPHIVHLSAPALEILQKHDLPEEGQIFTTTGHTPISGFSKVKRRLDNMLPDLEPWRFHDLRTAFATAMAEAGESESTVDRVLNHAAMSSAPSAVARVYNRSAQLPQRARVLDKWAELVTRDRAEVVRLLSQGEISG